MALPSDRLVSPDDLAAYLGCSKGALYVQKHRGEAPGALAIKIGRTLRWNPEVINNWVESQQPNNGDAA